MGGAPLVLCAFSRPGDLNFDAFITASSCSVFLGSNRKAVVKRLGSCARQASSVEFAVLQQPTFGLA